VIIRPAKDADDLASFIDIVASMHHESNFRGMTFSPEFSANRVAGMMASDDYLVLVAEDAGRIVGGLLACIGPSDFGPDLMAHDRGVFIYPERRGGFAAVHLIRAYVEWAQSRGAKRISFDVKAGIRPKRTARLLEWLGFQSVGTCHVYGG
tara:strand:- start:626 stop:1078 length:453 start_codon:yes stop_codon:yes gene_type:complete